MMRNFKWGHWIIELQLLNDEMEMIQRDAPYGRMGTGQASRYQASRIVCAKWAGAMGSGD